MKIISGKLRADGGTLVWNGAQVNSTRPAAAHVAGITMVLQYFSLFDSLTVTENIAFDLPASTRPDELVARIATTTARYGLVLQPQRPLPAGAR